jgi:hypothetical protein
MCANSIRHKWHYAFIACTLNSDVSTLWFTCLCRNAPAIAHKGQPLCGLGHGPTVVLREWSEYVKLITDHLLHTARGLDVLVTRVRALHQRQRLDALKHANIQI